MSKFQSFINITVQKQTSYYSQEEIKKMKDLELENQRKKDKCKLLNIRKNVSDKETKRDD